MTVSLKNTFLANARALTFKDNASVTWSINASTNELSATATGSGPSPANPAATIGLSAVNGTAATYMRSDSAPALSQEIAPTWTGAHVFSPSAAGTAVRVNSAAGNYGIAVYGASTDAARIGLIDGNAGNESYQLRVGGLAVGSFDIYDATAGASRFSITSSGAVTVVGQFAINGGTPTAKPTGYGTPSGSVTASLSSSSTLAQVAGTLAAFLSYMKSIGFVGA